MHMQSYQRPRKRNTMPRSGRRLFLGEPMNTILEIPRDRCRPVSSKMKPRYRPRGPREISTVPSSRKHKVLLLPMLRSHLNDGIDLMMTMLHRRGKTLRLSNFFIGQRI